MPELDASRGAKPSRGRWESLTQVKRQRDQGRCAPRQLIATGRSRSFQRNRRDFRSAEYDESG